MTGSSSRHPWLLILTVLQNTPGRQRGRARERPLSARGFAVKSPSALRVEADGTASRGPAGPGVVGRPEALRCRRQWPGGGREVAGRWPGGGLRRATPTRSPAPALRALRRLPGSLCRHRRGLGRRRQRRESGGVTRAALRPRSVREALLPRGREGSDLSSPQRDLRDLRCADRAGPLRPAQRPATAGPRSRVCLGSPSLLLVVISSPVPSPRSVNRCDLTVRYLFLRFKRLSMLKTPYFTGDTGGCQ